MYMYFQRDDRGISLFPVLHDQIKQEFWFIDCSFRSFEDIFMKIVTLHLKTGCVTANASAVGITSRCLATVLHEYLNNLGIYNYIG